MSIGLNVYKYLGRLSDLFNNFEVLSARGLCQIMPFSLKCSADITICIQNQEFHHQSNGEIQEKSNNRIIWGVQHPLSTKRMQDSQLRSQANEFDFSHTVEP